MKGLAYSIFLFGFLSCAGTCRADTALDEACTSYSRHEYAISMKQLDDLPANERGAKSSYYRALNLQALHRYSEANEEFRKVATQKKDLTLAYLARQGMIGLACRSRQTAFNTGTAGSTNSNAVSSQPLKFNAAGYAVDDRWKVQKPGFSRTGVSKNTLPDNWTFVKTSNGCGRH